MLGGTFSTADLYSFADLITREMRVSTADGTYSLLKTEHFEKDAFKKYCADVEAKHTKELKEEAERLAGSKSYVRDLATACNNAITNMHNDLIAGQTAYGYVYTLERPS